MGPSRHRLLGPPHGPAGHLFLLRRAEWRARTSGRRGAHLERGPVKWRGRVNRADSEARPQTTREAGRLTDCDSAGSIASGNLRPATAGPPPIKAPKSTLNSSRQTNNLTNCLSPLLVAVQTEAAAEPEASGQRRRPRGRRRRRHRIESETREDVSDELDFIAVEPDVQRNLRSQQLAAGSTTTTPSPPTRTTTVGPNLGARPKVRPAAQLQVGGTGGATYERRSSTGPLGEPDGPDEGPRRLQPAFDSLSRLYLDASMGLEVSAFVGETAYLLCRLRAVQQAEQLQVSWVRNLQILTSGKLRYTSDERFRPVHLAGSQDWLLEIHSVRPDDEGAYECQVNSLPRPASVLVTLQVIAGSLEILEGPQLRVEVGAPIELTCRLRFSSRTALAADRPPGGAPGALPAANSSRQHYIYWYKAGLSVEYNNPRGNVQVARRELADGLESVLRLEGAGEADEGQYVCKLLPELNDLRPAQAQVWVGPQAGSGGGPIGGGWPSKLLLALLAATLTVAMLAGNEQVVVEREQAKELLSSRRPARSLCKRSDWLGTPPPDVAGGR